MRSKTSKNSKPIPEILSLQQEHIPNMKKETQATDSIHLTHHVDSTSETKAHIGAIFTTSKTILYEINTAWNAQDLKTYSLT